jgi:hypothetical protein
MGAVLQFPSPKDRLLATLSPEEREFAENLLRISPRYRYELSGLPRLNPIPASGVPSAVAAAKMWPAWVKAR